MTHSPLDDLPTYNRVSIRAVLVQEGEDPSAALTEAGFANAIAVPVMLGEELDHSAGMLGNGITPNITAVLETEQSDEADAPSAAPSPSRDSAPSSEPVTVTSPPAYGLQSFAPIHKAGT